jgi:hypothetical protein
MRRFMPAVSLDGIEAVARQNDVASVRTIFASDESAATISIDADGSA